MADRVGLIGLDRGALDRYLTREQPCEDEAPLPRCSSCGRFLKAEPDGIREYVAVRRCSGEPSVFTQTHPDDVLKIIGEEYRGEVFERAFAPPCGEGAFEIDPSEAGRFRHEPHFFEDPWGRYVAEVRVCVCGAVSEETLA